MLCNIILHYFDGFRRRLLVGGACALKEAAHVGHRGVTTTPAETVGVVYLGVAPFAI